MQDNTDDLTIKGTAAMLNCTIKTVYRLIRDGRLHPRPQKPFYAKHGPVGIPRAEVEALLAER